MKTKVIFGLAAGALILTGCENTKEEVMAEPINIIVHNVSSLACSSLAIDKIKEKAGVSKLLYHEDNNNVTCDDYNAKTGLCVEKFDLIARGSKGYGNRACIFGTDEVPKSKGQDIETDNVNDVTAKEYLLIVKHTSKFSCNAYTIEDIAKKYDYNTELKFYIDKDGTANCNSYGRTNSKADKCQEADLKNKVKKEVLIGNWTCVIGTNKAPTN